MPRVENSLRSRVADTNAAAALLGRSAWDDGDSLVMVLDTDGTIIDLNQPMAESLGKSVTGLKGAILWKHMQPENGMRHQKLLQQVVESGRSQRFESGGNGTWHESVLRPCFGENGKVIGATMLTSETTEKHGLRAALIDITDLKRDRDALALLGSQQRAILETVPSGVSFIKDRRIIWSNPVHDKLLGYEIGESVGLELASLYARREDYARVGREGYAALSRGDSYTTELKIRRKDGAIIWCSVHGRAVNAANLEEGSIWSIFDITERKRDEEALRVSECRYSALFANKIIAIARCRVITDEQSQPVDYRILQVNEAYERIVGIKKAAIEGRKVTEVFPGVKNYSFDYIGVLGKVALGGGEIMVEQFLESSRQYLSIYAYSPIPGEFIALLTDVTQRKRAEEALRQSEQRYRLASRRAKFGTYAYDFDTGVGDWSPELKALWGLEPDCPVELDADKLYKGLHPEDRSVFLATMTAANDPAGNGVLDLDYRVVWPDGSVRWLHVHGLTEFVDEGKSRRPRRGAGAAFDITERKRAEEALREREEQLRLFVEHAPAAIAMLDTQMCYVVASQRWVADYGLEGQDLRGRSHYEIFPEIPERWKKIHRRCLAGAVEQAEADQFVRADGSTQWLHWEIRPWHVASATVGGIVIFSEDITERKQAEEALQKSQSFLRSIIDNTPALIYVIDRAQRFVLANAATAALLGWTFEEMVGKTRHALMPKEIALEHEANDRQVIEAGKVFEFEESGTFKGRSATYLTVKFPIRHANGEIHAIGGVSTEITQRKLTEERITDSLREKEVLLKEIHHRVKNNMQIISSLMDLQADTLDNPALVPVFAEMRDRVRSMALVHEKLYQSESLAWVEFAEYAQSLMESVWIAHRSPSLTIRLNLDLQPVWLSINCAIPCGLLLNELALNALKHAFPGRSEGEVTVELRAASQGQVHLAVRDNGVGLPAGLDWRQAPSLGLCLVHTLVRQLDGTLEVKVDAGTQFQITFPQPGAQPFEKGKHA